jgi:hypothetical protein
VGKIASPLAFNTDAGNLACAETALRIRDLSVFTEINPGQSGNPPPGKSPKFKFPPHDISVFIEF